MGLSKTGKVKAMKSVGIIAEYNPFHNGHAYHIGESRKRTGAQCVVAVISGNFVQRGAPAVTDKFTRAHCALVSGADLVLELPTVYSTGSAELFAAGAVSVLNGLNGISYISFGSECHDLGALVAAAGILAFESDDFRSLLRKYVSSGMSMPAARQQAVQTLMGPSDFAAVFRSPNNILAIEYIKALKRSGSSISPVNIVRKDNSYHDKKLTGSISSATAVRQLIENGHPEDAKTAIPPSVYSILQNNYGKKFPLNSDAFSSLINYAIEDKFDRIADFSDVGEALANKIRRYFKSPDRAFSFSDIAMALKSKDITYTRICRAIIHILLDIDSDLISRIRNAGFPSYARILASNETGRIFLSSVKEICTIPIISNCRRDFSKLDDVQESIFGYDLKATEIYNNIVRSRFGTQLKDDFRSRPLML